MISIQSLIKIFGQLDGSNLVALNNISLDIEKGEFVAVVGESGSGKTTLLGCITGEISLSAGTIHINGHDLHAISHSDLGKMLQKDIGILYNETHLNLELSFSCYENVDLNLLLRCPEMSKNERKIRIQSLFNRFGLSHLEHRKVSALSGGERQMIAFVKEISHKPKILLMDEPTSSLDQTRAQEFMVFIQKYLVSEGLTSIIVTHDEAIARQTDKIHRLSKGRHISISEMDLIEDYDEVSIPVSDDGQIFIPKEIMEKANLSKKVFIRVIDDIVTISSDVAKLDQAERKLKGGK